MSIIFAPAFPEVNFDPIFVRDLDPVATVGHPADEQVDRAAEDAYWDALADEAAAYDAYESGLPTW